MGDVFSNGNNPSTINPNGANQFGQTGLSQLYDPFGSFSSNNGISGTLGDKLGIADGSGGPLGNVLGGGGVNFQGENTGFPDMPSFLSNLNPDGTLKSQYQLQAENPLAFQSTMSDEEKRLAGIPDVNKDPLHQLEGFTQSGSDNPWVKAQMAAQEQAQGQAMGAAKANAQSSNTAAQDAMAARGGLNTGAMENLNRNAANNSTMAGQGVIGQGLQQKGAIQTQNAQNQLGVLENLPGQEVQSLQPALQEQSLWQNAAAQNQNAQQQLAEDQQRYKTGVNQYNIGNAEGGLNAQNQFNMTNYQNQLAKQAGTEQAQAMANRGKK